MPEQKNKRSERSGRKYDQRMKPFLVYEYLMRETDEEHCASANEIGAYLDENFGISAERRSICRDIHEINKVLLMLENQQSAQYDITSLDEAEALIVDDEDNKYIRYNKSKKGFYAAKRRYENFDCDDEDIRLLAESVLSSKLIDDNNAERLVNFVHSMVSVYQAENMTHKAIVKDRVKISNKNVYYMVKTISDAIGKGGRDTRKISFTYLKRTLPNARVFIERKGGNEYKITPHSLIVDNGYYYLLGYSERNEALRAYRVDRMEKVRILNERNLDADLFKNLDTSKYTQGHFGMYDGMLERVTLNCSINLLNAMIDRFGTENVHYSRGRTEGFFNIQVPVYVSNMFFGWLSGFGKQVVISSPQSVKVQYASYLKDLQEWHSRFINQ